jgi:sugar phosphate isomerase/epimerase
MQFVMFSKHLAPLSVEEAARRAGAIGFCGLDLTVRPGGHVEPEQVATLPAAVDRVRRMGCEVPMITTAIISAGEPYAEDIFRAAADSGIRELKLGYWHYRGFGSLRQQLDEAMRDLDGLSLLARRTGVRASIHSHSGDFLSADGAVVWFLLKDRDPKELGAYVDPGHMVVEGGLSGWRMCLDLLSPWVSLVAVKSMAWEHSYDPALAQERWRAQMVPLRQGTVPWLEVFRCLHQIGFDGIVSVHSEYQGSHSWRDLSLEELLVQTAEDLAFIKCVATRAKEEACRG